MGVEFILRLYVPNLVKISSTIPEIMGCLDVYGSGSSFSRAYTQIFWTAHQDYLATYVDHQISWKSDSPFRNTNLSVCRSSFKMPIHVPKMGVGI